MLRSIDTSEMMDDWKCFWNTMTWLGKLILGPPVAMLFLLVWIFDPIFESISKLKVFRKVDIDEICSKISKKISKLIFK